jgi:flagellar biosynthesis component FlhA
LEEEGRLPELQIHIELGAPLDVLAAASFFTALSDSVRCRCSDLLAALGLPGEPRIEISRTTNGEQSERILRLRVNGVAMPHPGELSLAAYCYVAGAPMRDSTAGEYEEWLQTRREADPALLEWAGLCCVEILKRRPGLLASPAIMEAYLESLDIDGQAAGRGVYDASLLRAILAQVLAQRISLADLATVAEVLKRCGDARMPPEDVVEELLEELRPRVLEILIEPTYLKQIVLDENDTDMFPLLRDGLYYELGVRFPDFRFVETEDMGAKGFCFRINDLTSLPRRGLAAGTCMVGEEPGDGALLNPANGNRCREIDQAERENVAPGPHIWSPMGYIVLALAADLRENARCFVDVSFTANRLSKLEEAFPDLVSACRTRYSDHQMTRVLRNLATEGFPVRDLRAILYAALDFDMIETDPRFIVFDNRLSSPVPPEAAALQDPANVAAFVRMELKRQLSHLTMGGRNTLVVYLLSPDAERYILQAAMRYREETRDGKEDFREWFGQVRQGALLVAIRREIGKLAPLAPLYPILTTVEVRAWVRQLIADEFPRMPVLAYQELTAELNIHPKARISPNFETLGSEGP